MEGIILAGGLGTRLRSRFQDIPKAMAPVAGRPFLSWLLDLMDEGGFRRVVLSVGHLNRAIFDAFGTRHGRIELSYAVEETPLGTGGAIRRALGAGEEPVWVMNGDTIIRLSYAEMRAAHERRQANPLAITMALVPVEDASRYGAVQIADGRVTAFSATGRSGRSLINSGIYLLHRRVFDGFELPAAFSFEGQFLAPHIERLEISAFVADGWFIDIGVPEDYDRAQLELPAVLAGVR